jgi:hypothetical protein
MYTPTRSSCDPLLGNVDKIELKTFLERFEFDFLYCRVNIQKVPYVIVYLYYLLFIRTFLIG